MPAARDSASRPSAFYRRDLHSATRSYREIRFLGYDLVPRLRDSSSSARARASAIERTEPSRGRTALRDAAARGKVYTSAYIYAGTYAGVRRIIQTKGG